MLIGAALHFGAAIPLGIFDLRGAVSCGPVPVVGELSWLNLLVPATLFLEPLTRFPGFVWLIAAGFGLPSALERVQPAAGGGPVVHDNAA